MISQEAFLNGFVVFIKAFFHIVALPLSENLVQGNCCYCPGKILGIEMNLRKLPNVLITMAKRKISSYCSILAQ